MKLTLESQGYLESLYRAYLEDPLSLPEDWRRYFSALTLEDLEDGRRERQAAPLPGEALDLGFLLKVEALRQAYRELGHLAARIDPLGRERPRPPGMPAGPAGRAWPTWPEGFRPFWKRCRPAATS